MNLIPYPLAITEKNVIKVLDKLGPGMPRTLMPEESISIPGFSQQKSVFMPVGRFGISFQRIERNSMVEFQLIHEQLLDLGTIILNAISDNAGTKIESHHRKQPTVEEAKYYYSTGWMENLSITYQGETNKNHTEEESSLSDDTRSELLDKAYYFNISKHLIERCQNIRNRIIRMTINEIIEETNEPWKWIPELSPEDREIYKNIWVYKKDGLSWEKISELTKRAVNSVKTYHRHMLKVFNRFR